jgi:hypothetical protein
MEIKGREWIGMDHNGWERRDKKKKNRWERKKNGMEMSEVAFTIRQTLFRCHLFFQRHVFMLQIQK